MRDDEPRLVWTSLPITHWDLWGTRYFNTGCACFPGSSRLGIEPKTPGWLVQDPTTSLVDVYYCSTYCKAVRVGKGW